jgi:hypothetical protein
VKAHFQYLKYVVRHKWFVARACLKMGVPLWRAIVHDWTKFTPSEWGPYVHQFFNPDGSRRTVRDKSGAYDPNQQPDAFKFAWLHHQRNKHHWQAWVSIGDFGNITALPMPETYIREMVADWIGAGQAISGETSPVPWYEANKEKKVLHLQTRLRTEELLKRL